MRIVTVAAAVTALTLGMTSCGSSAGEVENPNDGETRVSQDTEADKKALEELERKQQDAWARDATAYASTFAEDADFVDVMGGHLEGRAAIEKSLRQGFEGFMANTRMSDPKERTIRFISPDSAVVVTKGNCILRGGAEKCRPEDLSIQTKVAVRQNGEWLFQTFQNTRIQG